MVLVNVVEYIQKLFEFIQKLFEFLVNVFIDLVKTRHKKSTFIVVQPCGLSMRAVEQLVGCVRHVQHMNHSCSSRLTLQRLTSQDLIGRHFCEKRDRKNAQYLFYVFIYETDFFSKQQRKENCLRVGDDFFNVATAGPATKSSATTSASKQF